MLEGWHARGRRVATATLVDISGSSPRPLGSEMAINDLGEVAGYVSGGCVEAAVATQALEVLEHGKPVMLDYGAGSPVLDVQLTCGGRIRIFVRAITDLENYVSRLRSARDARVPIDVCIDLDDGSHRFDAPALATGSQLFRKRHLPTPRLIVVGGDPVTLALCRLAPIFGYEVALLRPYGPAAPPVDTPLCQYDTRPLRSALRDLQLDASCAVYTLTHDMDDDHSVLIKALASEAFAIGALGSRSKSFERQALLRDAGIDADRMARLNTPAGLNIGAREPHEIALSVLAELVERRPRETAAAT
ncbi:XdhC family protein [Salinisphaera aquimarina]